MLSGEFFDALDKAVTKMRGESAAKASKEMEEAEQSEDDDVEMEDIYLGPGLGSVSVPRRHARRNEGRARVFADSLRDGKKVVALCAARQRLALAMSFHPRLGADSILARLPMNAEGGGDLHEMVASEFRAISGSLKALIVR